MFSINSHLVLESRNQSCISWYRGLSNGLNFYFTGLFGKISPVLFCRGTIPTKLAWKLVYKSKHSIFREFSSSDGFLPLLSSHTLCLRFCGKNKLCHFTLWHNCCVKQTIYSSSVKNYCKVNTIIFSSAIVWLLQTFFCFPTF